MGSRQVMVVRRHSALGSVAHAAVAFAGLAAWAVAPRLGEARRRDGTPSVPDVWYAHRGLHDAGSGLTKQYAGGSEEYIALARRMARKAGYGGPVPAKGADESKCAPIAPENSLAAFAAACEAGFGIELDLQMTADHKVVVVHDSDLERVAGDSRRIKDLTYAELTAIPLFPAPCVVGDSKVQPMQVESLASGGAEPASERTGAADGHAKKASARAAVRDSKPSPESATSSAIQHVPLFSDVLDVVAGRVPIIVEYKFDHQGWDSRDRELMELGDGLLRDYERRYDGRYVVESFNPMAMRWYRNARPEVCRGQLAAVAPFPVRDVADITKTSSKDFRDWLAGKLAFDWLSRPDFVAYDWHGVDSAQMRLARWLGVIPVAWTVRSADELAECSHGFDRHIFEAFVPTGSAQPR